MNREENAATSQMMNNINIQPQTHPQPKPRTWLGTTLLNRTAITNP